MSTDEFEKYMQRKIQQHEEAVDMALWDKIEANLKKTDNDPKPLYRGLSIAFLIIMALTPSVFILNNATPGLYSNKSSAHSAYSKTGKIFQKNKKVERNVEQPMLPAFPKFFESKEVDEIKADNVRAIKIYHAENNPSKTINHSKLMMENQLASMENESLEYFEKEKNESAPQQLVKEDYNPVANKPVFSKVAFNPIHNKMDSKIILGGCPSAEGTDPAKWFAEVYVNPIYVFKQLSGNDADYIYKKDSSESRKFSYGLGVRLSREIGKGFIIKTGLEYTQINEKFAVKQEGETRYITVVTVKQVNGINVYDTVSIKEVDYNESSAYNTYKSISVPVIASYEIGNDVWRAGFSGGVIFNLYQKYSGSYIDPSNKTSSIAGNNVYRKGLGIALYGGISAYRKISPSLEIYAEPHFIYQLTNISNSSARFNQKFHLAGLQLGLRYDLSFLRQQNFK